MQVRWERGQDLHLPHLSVSEPSALVPATLRSTQPCRASDNKSLDPASLSQPAQSKYLRPSRFSRLKRSTVKGVVGRQKQRRKRGKGKSNAFKVHPACYFCCPVGRELLILEGWQKRTSLCSALQFKCLYKYWIQILICLGFNCKLSIENITKNADSVVSWIATYALPLKEDSRAVRTEMRAATVLFT